MPGVAFIVVEEAVGGIGADTSSRVSTEIHTHRAGIFEIVHHPFCKFRNW